MLRIHSSRIANGNALLGLAEALVRMMELFRTEPRVMSNAGLQAFADAAKRAFVLRAWCQVPFTPKWHLMLHLAARAQLVGNPAYYHTFFDEGINHELAKVARGCHRRRFHNRVLAAFKVVITRAAKRFRE